MQQGKKIVIFEDDFDTLEVLKIILEGEGYVVQTSGDAYSLDLILANQPNLVLLDHRLSNGLGDEFCIILKTHPDTQHIPVVLVSADNNIASISQKCRADDFIAKPFDIDILVDKIKGYLG